MPAAWYPDALAWLITGMPWRAWDAGESALLVVAAGLPAAGEVGHWWDVLVRLLVLAEGAGGAGGDRPRPAALSLSCTHRFSCIQAQSAGGFVYTWYLFPALRGRDFAVVGFGFLSPLAKS